ncbi:hypothetical protein [Altererythrobacter sp. MF3-039]|uniref:hypothetical protein n=1 Tax=Altererythrobacter sp. MF3-039 TaxID=3252901 RepID=UPI00390C96DA
MFIGHWAPALAAAAATSKAPRLGTLFVAAQLTDFAFFIFALIGIERMRITPGMTAMNPMDLYHLPYTHSLAGSVGWGIGFAILIFVLTKDRMASIIGGLVVISHWFIDLLVHRPDLTLWGAPPKLGFGLWNQPVIAMPLELIITFGALAWYAKRTRGPAVPIAILGLVLFAMQMIDWFGPPPAEAGPQLYLTALVAFTVASAIAWWVGTTRKHKRAEA